MTTRDDCGRALDWIDPVRALRAFASEPYTLLLQGGGTQPWGRKSYLCAFPAFVIEDADPARGFERLKAGFRPARHGAEQGFAGGYAGLMAYDLGQAFERLPAHPPGRAACPAIAMGWYEAVLVFDHQTQSLCVQGDPAAAQRLIDRLGRGGDQTGPQDAGAGTLTQDWPDTRYLDAVARARDYIAAGDIFQVNLSHAFTGRIEGEDAPLRVFERLAANSPAAFSAVFVLSEDQVILTNSPERFLKASASGAVETRPIKGTRPRRADPVQDRAEAEALSASIKDRAENLMIVDLMRNDMSRVCRSGSVVVPHLCDLESYANVHHLVSVVEGELAADHDVFDLLAASFPPGSITGAPKVRAMEIISELEGEPRGPYCGALGWIDGSAALDLNVMIRTAALRRSGGRWRASVRSGGGIVADSDPQAEYEETLTKASALRRAFGVEAE